MYNMYIHILNWLIYGFLVNRFFSNILVMAFQCKIYIDYFWEILQRILQIWPIIFAKAVMLERFCGLIIVLKITCGGWGSVIIPQENAHERRKILRNFISQNNCFSIISYGLFLPKQNILIFILDIIFI